MQKLKHIFHQNFPEARRRHVITWLAIILGSSLAGFLVTYFSFRQGIDFGDGSTFFSFAHNLANGEVIYKDFIHFRTPGSYFLQALFLNIFGDQQASLRFALGFEAHVLYTFFFAVAAGIFLRFKHVFIGALSLFLVVMLPPYVQLRTVLALMAVVLYIQAYRAVKARSWLVGSGIFVGLAFTFGQEAALMAIVTIGFMELFQSKKNGFKVLLRRVGTLAAGVLIGVLPLLLYIIIKSDIATFLYYTFYYAFILQPQGMDLVYPPPSHANTIFYMVFVFYLVIFYIFYSSKKLGMIESVLLVFGIIRLVTLLGRSDIGHLLFILPEVLFLTVYGIVHIMSARFTKAQTLRFVPYGIALAVSFYAAIKGSGMLLIVSALIIYLAFYLRKKPSNQSDKVMKNSNAAMLAVATSLFSVIIYILYPFLTSTTDALSTRGLTDTQLGGVNVRPEVFTEVTAISEAVTSLHPTTIFSYPIQPYYYNLAPKHAARFMTFEPQTTEREQEQTIEDLKRTHPEVILYDPVQADSLSGPLGKINAYVKSNYRIERVTEYSRTFWIMVPNDQK